VCLEYPESQAQNVAWRGGNPLNRFSIPDVPVLLIATALMFLVALLVPEMRSMVRGSIGLGATVAALLWRSRRKKRILDISDRNERA
jgi:Flp pilus assembly protein TadB